MRDRKEHLIYYRFIDVATLKKRFNTQYALPKKMNIQGAAEITPTFQKGITNKWYEVSPKTFYFPNVDITKFFLL
jgi:hypothetical protein